MHQYRITKYDPANRNKDGAYLVNEWTCHTDIGKSFEGKLLSVEEYLATESKYIDAVTRFFQQSGLPHLRLTNLMTQFFDDEAKDLRSKLPELWDERFTQTKLIEDQKLFSDQIPIVAQMAIRGLIHCNLEIAERFFVYFGWDYYMYLGTSTPSDDAVHETNEAGLFVEAFDSPYGVVNIQTPKFSLALCNPEDGTYTREVAFKDPDRELVRRILGYSSEHTIHGYFDITLEQYELIKHQLIEQPDVSGYDLVINTSGD